MKMLSRLMALLCLLTLAACGGGGNDPLPGTDTGGGGGTTLDPTIEISLSDETVSSSAPVTVSVIVKDANGDAASGLVVSFSSEGGLGTFSPTTKLTDADGKASVQMSPATATTSGADRVVASVTVGGVAIEEGIGFEVTPTTGTTGTATIAVSVSSTTVSASAPTNITATLRDGLGVAIVGQVVSFTTNGGLGAFSANTALTNADGVAQVQLAPASSTSNGADLVIAKATVEDSDVSGTIGFQVAATTTPAGTSSLSIALSTTDVTVGTPATVTVTVKDAIGQPLPEQVIKFSAVDGLGTFNPASALSNANGTVTVKLTPSSTTSNGADLAVATASISGEQVTATAGFSVTSSGAPATGTPSITLSLSSTVVTTSAPVTATAVVKDSTGASVAGQVVRFSTIDGLGTFGASSALTDATGTASVVLTAVGAGRSGADQVVATTTVNGTVLQASQGFQLTAASATISQFTSDITSSESLSAYGQANLTVKLSGVAAGTPIDVSVSSTCVAKGKATLTPASDSTTTGVVTFTYRDNGCGATDTSDSLQAVIVGTSTTLSLNIKLTPPTVSSITFTSATPQTIYLKGSGLTETSTVVFTVVDTAGNGLANQLVSLEPTTLSGGLTVDGESDPSKYPLTKLTDSLGRVNVLINSGTVPTPVRVKATLLPPNESITTVSSALSIAVGLPSQLNFSLSQIAFNIEGYDYDGTTNVYTIIASDRLANPVPTGTSINFIAEGGQIEPIKTTTLASGLAQATANFVSASPRPQDGRITILAYSLGEESFLDTNGNNVWDQPADTQFQDLGAVFLSRKYLNTYFQATDQLIPLSIPGVSASSACVPVTSSLLGLDASIPTQGGTSCDGGWGRAYVRRAAETVLSTSVARPIWNTKPAGLRVAEAASSCPLAQDETGSSKLGLITGYAETTGTIVRADTDRYYRLDGATTLYGLPTSGVVSFVVADNNPVRLNPVAAGSTISVSATDGLTVRVVGGSPVPSSSSATSASVEVTFDGATTGVITLSITSPRGVTTTVTQGVSTAPPTGTPCP